MGKRRTSDNRLKILTACDDANQNQKMQHSQSHQETSSSDSSKVIFTVCFKYTETSFHEGLLSTVLDEGVFQCVSGVKP